MRVGLLVVAMLALATGSARAEDIATYEAEGDAELSGADPRVAALDEAFGRAVAMALADVVAPEARSGRKVDLDREIVGHARLWVAKFTVTKDVTRDDRRQLIVTVRVDREKLRTKLTEMSVATMTAGEASKGRSITVLMRVADAKGVRASFGATGHQDLPGLGALSSALRGAGMTTKRPPTSGPAVRNTGDVPLDDTEAESLATEAKAEFAAIAGVTVGGAVPVRGVAIQGALVTAHLRVIERRGRKAVGDGKATVAARGTEDSVVGHAIDRAVVAAALEVLPPSRPSLTQASGFSGDDSPISEPGVVLVRLGAKTPWGLVAAEQKYLAGAKGVQRAVLRRLSPGGWVIGVTTTESVERIAQIARKTPAADTAVKVRVNGEIVEISIGSP